MIVVLDTQVPPILPASIAEPQWTQSFDSKDGYEFLFDSPRPGWLRILHPRTQGVRDVPMARVRYVETTISTMITKELPTKETGRGKR